MSCLDGENAQNFADEGNTIKSRQNGDNTADFTVDELQRESSNPCVGA